MLRNLAITIVALLLTTTVANAQVTISGTIKSTQKQGLAGASIAIRNSYSGTTSTTEGNFSFVATDTGKQVLTVSMIGYTPWEQEIFVGTTNISINPILKEEITELKAVTITAGSFEASDKKRTTVLKSVDVVTTAGQQADIIAALKTLPGAQQVGETEGLFVRGGTGVETKVFIDGMMVTNPFYSNVPDVAQRARFSPLLFKGTNFSSGGYSAQFSQALSSALVLESLDLPSRSESNWIISSAQLSVTGQHLSKTKNTSVGAGIAYTNLGPYFGVIKQKYSYTKAPELVNMELHARHKTKNGMLKFYGYANANTIAFNKSSIENETWQERFQLNNKNVYTNLTYTTKLDNDWKLYAGGSISYNKDRIARYILAKDTVNNYFLPNLTNLTQQAKLVLTKNLQNLTRLNLGAEWQHMTDKVDAKDSIPFITIHDNYFAAFAEAEIYISSRFAARPGLRLEYSELLGEMKLAPRISIAYKLNDKSQVSAAFGDFYQKPETNWLFRNQSLSLTKATHYILNYQYSGNGQTMRVELFQKNYHRLISFPFDQPTTLSNNGTGYARGFEFFWRDKTTIKGLDYWVAYSFLDTKRQYLDYPQKTQPPFAAKHTASLVVKKFVEPISTYFSMTYTYASGRPYYDPNQPANLFMKTKTIDYNSLGLQLNWLTQIGKAYTVFIINVSNVLGSKQVFSYRFSSTPVSAGNYAREEIGPQAKRFIFIGAYISIGNDRRKQVLD